MPDPNGDEPRAVPAVTCHRMPRHSSASWGDLEERDTMAPSSARQVSVICAPPNGRNPGMTSVDLAFDRIARAAGVSSVTYWRLWDISEWAEVRGDVDLPASPTYHDPDSLITYQSIRGRLDEALSADRVVFWGDFMHMAVYQHHMADVLARAAADERLAHERFQLLRVSGHLRVLRRGVRIQPHRAVESKRPCPPALVPAQGGTGARRRAIRPRGGWTTGRGRWTVPPACAGTTARLARVRCRAAPVRSGRSSASACR